VNAVATAWGLHPGSISLVQYRGILVAAVAAAAAFSVFCGLQVNGIDFGSFLFHFSFPLLVVCCSCCVSGTKSDFTSIIPFASASLINCPIVNCRLASSMMFPAAFGVLFGLQVTDFDSFLRFFVFHFILLSRWSGLP
jgi:hypothetical protein